MGDASACIDALEPFLVKFRVLAQLAPGDVISIDESGNWSLVQSSSWRSGLRAFWSFIRGQHLQPQRQTFLAAARETVRTVQRHVSLLMRTAVFLRAMDGNGSLSRDVVSRMPAADIEEIEAALHTLQSVCGHICDGLRGLAVMKASEPYGKDATFVSQVDVTIRDSLLHFLDSVHRRVGPEYASRVFPYLPTSSSSTEGMKRYAWVPPMAPIAITATTPAPSWGHAPGSAGAPAFYAHGPAKEPPKPPPAVAWVPTAPATTTRTAPLSQPLASVPQVTALMPPLQQLPSLTAPPSLGESKISSSAAESKSSTTTIDTKKIAESKATTEDDDTPKPKPINAWNSNQKPSQSQTLPRATSQVSMTPNSRPSTQTSAPDISRGRRELL